MTTNVRLAIAAVVLLVFGVTLLMTRSSAAGGDPKALAKKVDAIAAAISKKNKSAAKKLSNALAKEQEVDWVYNVMLLFKPRNRKGFGVGNKPGAIQPDGLEKFLRDAADGKVPDDLLQKEKAALIQLAYRAAAVAEFSVSPVMLPKRKQGKKSGKNWLLLTGQMRSASHELIKAANFGKVKAIKESIANLNRSCNQCHSTFR